MSWMKRSMTPGQKAAGTLAAICLFEGTWVVANSIHGGARFLAYLGFAPGRAGTPAGWAAAAVVTILFVVSSARLPSVRENLVRFSGLKLLAIGVAVSAGILEEVFFRKLVMDYLLAHGFGAAVQIGGAALSFGLAHGVWGVLGRSIRAAVGATIATGVLGGALGIVYILSSRSLAACIASHFVINLLVEPGLVLAASRGEMSRARRAAPAVGGV